MNPLSVRDFLLLYFSLFTSLTFYFSLFTSFTFFCIIKKQYHRLLRNLIYMMKSVSLFAILFFAVTLIAEAQMRKDLAYPEEYSATLMHSGNQNAPGSWMNLLNMTMSHSYSMNFSNFGGQMQNLNAYTNHMFFDISDRVNARVDVSLLHSPFGNSFMNKDDFGTQIIIDQARLDFRLSSNSSISLQFSQRPSYYGYDPFGYGNRNSPHRMSRGF